MDAKEEEIRKITEEEMRKFEDEIEKGQVQSTGTSTATTTPPDTLDLKGDTDTGIATTTVVETEIFELTEFDLILTETTIDFEALVDEEIDEIDDLIIEEIENTQ